MIYVLCIIIVFLLIWYFRDFMLCTFAGWTGGNMRTENYRSCGDCDNHNMPTNGISVLNPFIWPYSGTPCVGDLYNSDKSTDAQSSGSLTHLNAPDHVVLTN